MGRRNSLRTVSVATLRLEPPFGATLTIGAMTTFVAHLFWEIAQCKLFFVHGTLPFTITSMLGATFGDVGLTSLIFIIMALVTKDLFWIFRRWTSIHWLIMEITALVLSIGVEKIGLLLNRWSYTSITPILPLARVSLLPVLQLAILIPATFAVTAYLSLWWNAKTKDAAPDVPQPVVSIHQR